MQFLKRNGLALVTVLAIVFALALSQQGHALRNFYAPAGIVSLARAADVAAARGIFSSWQKAGERAAQDQGLSSAEKSCCDLLSIARTQVKLDYWFIALYVLAIAAWCWGLARKLSAYAAARMDEQWRGLGRDAPSGAGAGVQRLFARIVTWMWWCVARLGYLIAAAQLVAGAADWYENKLLQHSLACAAPECIDAHTVAQTARAANLKFALVFTGLGFIAAAAARSVTDLRRWLSYAWQFGKRCAYVLAFLAAAVVLFVLLDQGQDYLRLVTQPGASFWHQFWFVVGACGWAFASWYLSRQAVQQPFAGEALGATVAAPDIRGTLRKWLPRALGALPLAVVSQAFFMIRADLWGAAFALLTLAMLAFSILRRRMMRAAQRDAARAQDESIFCTAASALIIAFIIFLWVCLSPVTLPRHLGAPGLVFLVAAFWIVVGTIVFILIPLRNKKPTLASLPLLIFAVFSPFNDNHRIRVLAELEPDAAAAAPSPAAPQRAPETLSDYFAKWLQHNHGVGAGSTPAKKVPVYVVIAEGGGVRAAYWTAAVLGRLQDEHQQFRKHVFAISGISGGSLGAVVFDALLRQPLAQRQCRVRDPQAGAVRQSSSLAACGREILAQDFLAPALAGMLVPDTLQRFLPFALESLDRARFLEQAWEAGWHEVLPQSRGLTDSFLSLWPVDSAERYGVPLLFLNGAVVQTGQRIITAPLELSGFHDAVDVFERSQPPLQLRLSTAAHMSARFPGISPAGWFAAKADGSSGASAAGATRYLHVLDGGYFETLGASSAEDLMQVIKASAAARAGQIELKVLVITNGTPGDKHGSRRSSRFVSEIVDPPLTLMRTPNAHGDYFDAKMRAQPQSEGADNYIRVGMYPDTVEQLAQQCTPCRPPLGWALSPCTRADMDRALIEPRVARQLARVGATLQ